MATQLVERPDLSRRTALSKSEISTGEWCGIQGYYSRAEPRPWNVTPEMKFGSCLDAAVEIAVKALRADQPIPVATCLAAATEVAQREELDVDLNEIEDAIHQFGVVIAPRYKWETALSQHTIRVEIDGLGACEGHPDFILGDLIKDVKAKGKSVSNNDIWFGSELPFYALIRERETGEPVKHIGYWVWLRQVSPKWQDITVEVNADVLAEGMARARRQLHLRRLIDTVKERGADPAEFFVGPKFDSKCLDCAWRDVCETGQRRVRRLAKEGELDAAA